MSFFHLRSPAGTTWPPIPAPEVSQLWAAYQELDRTQWHGRADIEEMQLKQLRVLLEHCSQNVPYYRRLLSDAGLSAAQIDSVAQLSRLPLLTRELYQRHFDELQAQALPPGIVTVGEGWSSGTTGVPVKVVKTNRDSLWWAAFFLRDLEWCGMDPRGRLATIRLFETARDKSRRPSEGTTFPFWTQFCQLLLETGPTHALDIREDPRHQLDWLRRVDPDYLISMPTNLEFLASLLAETGTRLPRLRTIQAVGEMLSAEAQTHIEKGFGVPVKNLYSAVEAGYLASPCPSGHGLHVHAENVLVEVLDDSNRLCVPGQTGRMVLTSLHNFATPLVRYDLLDEVTLASEPCPCGRGLPLWTNIVGRRYPMMELPGGRRKSMVGLVTGVRQAGGCHQFQIVQRAIDHIVVRVVPSRAWQPEHAMRIRQAVQDEVGMPLRIDVEERSFLERPPGGKLNLAVIEMDASST